MNLQTINASASPEVQVNENFEVLDWATVYAKNPVTSSALTWGYFGGRWSGILIAASTLTLTNTSTNYVVVNRTTGVISVSTASTNWDDTASYARVYKLTTAGGVVTATEDHRAGEYGIISGAPANGTQVDNEVPTGTINSTTGSDGNGVFTLANSAIAGSVKAFNGSGLRLFNPTHFSVSGATVTYVAGAFPMTGDTHVFDYRY